jgi:PAT family beta-lactamase induction signal transducer AmpG
VLYQAGYGQIATIAPLFLRDTAEAGGLGLSTEQTGALYGSFGAFAIVAGAIVGGYFASWLGLRRAMPFLILGINLPNLAFYFLSVAMPSNIYLIGAAIGIENFGIGFGYTGVMLFMMQVVSVGRYQTSHYAICTGFMALGVTLFKMISGSIQLALGYQHFFLWVVLASFPSFFLAFKVVPKNSPSVTPPDDDDLPDSLVIPNPAK